MDLYANTLQSVGLTDMTFPNFNLSAAFRVAACASALMILQPRS
jgi:hypothetical protein